MRPTECQTGVLVLVIRDFTTACTCMYVCKHALLCNIIHSACVHVHMHMCTRPYGTMRLYTSLAYLRRYAAIHVNRPSGISQAAAIAAAISVKVKICYFIVFDLLFC